MRITIFFGHHKVGSTALQDYFSRNFQTLLDHKILYPMVDFEGLTSVFSGLKSDVTEEANKDLSFNTREPHNALAFKILNEFRKWHVPPYHTKLPHTSQMFHAIRCQINAFKPDNVVIISEVLAHLGSTSIDVIQRFKREFPDAEFQFIATLRRVDDYIMSWHSQRLRFPVKLNALDEGGLEPYLKGIHFDYKLMVKPWMEAFPDSKFVIRNHADVMKQGGSIEDFRVQSNLSYPEYMRPAKNSNPSYHRAVFEVARRAKNTLPASSAKIALDFLEISTPFLDLPNSRDIDLLGQEARTMMYDLFAPAHKFLGSIDGSGAFFPDIESVVECPPINYRDVVECLRPQIVNNLDNLEDKEVINFFQNI